MSHSEVKSGLSAVNDEDLIQRIMQGDKSAEQILVKRYWQVLYFILVRRSKDPQLAADITQDTFELIIIKIRQQDIENPAAIKAFIRQTGINLLLAYFRKNQRHRTDLSGNLDIHIGTGDQALYQIIYHQSAVKLVKQLMQELVQPRDQQILILYFIHHLEKNQVCQQLDLSPDNFDKVLHRARARLRQLVAEKIANKPTVENLLSIMLLVGVVYALSNPNSPANSVSAKAWQKMPVPVEVSAQWRHYYTQVRQRYCRVNKGSEKSMVDFMSHRGMR